MSLDTTFSFYIIIKIFFSKAIHYLALILSIVGYCWFLVARFDDVFEGNMARFYTAEMVMAIHSLHTMGYIHR